MNQSLERKINLSSLIKFTMPSIVMMIITSLYTVVDGTFVSRLIGTDAFSAVNIVYPLLSITIGLGTMFGTGLSAIISIKLGEGKKKEANENFTFVILFVVALGIAISIICFLLLEHIIYMLGANEAIYGYCYDYAFPLIFFFTADILNLIFQSFYIADGKPMIGLIVTIIGGLTNIILDYVFIAKLNMGISGAAVATGLGYALPVMFGLYYFSTNRNGLHFTAPKKAWKVLFYAATNGSSEMINYLSTSVTTFLFNVIMMKLVGQDGVAAIAILLYLDFVLVAVSLGYSMGCAPLISYNYGKQDRLKLKKIYKLSLYICIIIAVSITFITIAFSKNLASIFAAQNSSVYILAVEGLKIYAISYMFKGYNIFSSAMFTAFGNGKVSAILSCMRTLVFLTTSLIALSILFGVRGVWFASPIAEMLALSLSVFFTVKNRKVYHYI